MTDLHPIPFAPGYFVTGDGKVFSTRRSASPRQRKLVPDDDGYLRVGLMIDGKLKLVGVHRIVAWVFHGPPADESLAARHLDDVKTNNVPSNIAWGTSKQNSGDQVANLRHRSHTRPDTYGPSPAISAAQRARHAANRAAAEKFSASEVVAIKQELQLGASREAIAARFNVSKPTIALVAKAKVASSR